MEKDIFAAVVRLDKTKALLPHDLLYRSRHGSSPPGDPRESAACA
jgi:hypothetical protein